MTEDRTTAFDAIAGDYQKFRPRYPEPLLGDLRRYVTAKSLPDGDMLAVDVGAGTGISTRQIADLLGERWRVIGVEPGSGMLREARTGAGHALSFVQGSAENIPLTPGVASLVLAAQAIQWFDRPRFYAEAKRVLRADGVIALLQNNRDWHSSPLLGDYETLLEHYSPGYDRRYRDFDYHRELKEAGFLDDRVFRTAWSRPMARAEFLGMARSSSKVAAAIRSTGTAVVEGAIADLLDRYAIDDLLQITYQTELFVGRNPGPPLPNLA